MTLPTRFLIVMGVSGSGKTTTGRQLSERLGWEYYDADDFHPPANIAKMASGIPLSDADREPWLDSLRDLIAACKQGNRPGVLACSALKQTYRDHLVGTDRDVQIVYLKGSFDQIWARMRLRTNHYMKPNMLKSQFEALEEPADALVVDIGKEPGEICDEILSKIRPVPCRSRA
jgi:gluconokinase